MRTLICPCPKGCCVFSIWVGKFLVWNWSAAVGQIEVIAAKVRPDWLAGKQKDSWESQTRTFCVLATYSSYSSIFSWFACSDLWAHYRGICGQIWGRRLKNSWHAQVFPFFYSPCYFPGAVEHSAMMQKLKFSGEVVCTQWPVPDMIFVKSFTQAHTLTFRNLPEENT